MTRPRSADRCRPRSTSWRSWPRSAAPRRQGTARAGWRSPEAPRASQTRPPEGEEEMSEAERPDRLTRPVTVEDIRALAGPSTPHFALQVRNRIQKLIESLPERDPAWREGETRSPAWRSSPSTAATPAADGVASLMKELANDVWHIKCLPGLPWAVNAYLAERRPDRRRLPAIDRADLEAARRTRGEAHALTHAPPRPSGREPRHLRAARHPIPAAPSWTSRRRRSQADRRASARQVHGPLLLADLPRPRPRGRQGIKEGTRSLASR